MSLSKTSHHRRLELPSIVRVLAAPGMRGHTLVFIATIASLTAVALVGKLLASGLAWPAVFATGASLAGTYMIMGLMSLSERLRNLLIHSRMTIKTVTVGLIFFPLLAVSSYGLWNAAAPENMLLFQVLLVAFYAWVLAQAYFIASPLSNAMTRLEPKLQTPGMIQKLALRLAGPALAAMIAPVILGVWLLAAWLGPYYQSQPGTGGPIFLWTAGLTCLAVVSFLVAFRAGLDSMRRIGPARAWTIAGVFVTLWLYLMYRAVMLLTGYLSQGQAANPIIDGFLMVATVLGAMQTFAKKTLAKTDSRWTNLSPFLVFSFGSAYATMLYYFILQVPVTRTELSIILNGLVLASGVMTLVYIVARRLPRMPAHISRALAAPLLQSESFESIQENLPVQDEQIEESDHS